MVPGPGDAPAALGTPDWVGTKNGAGPNGQDLAFAEGASPSADKTGPKPGPPGGSSDPTSSAINDMLSKIGEKISQIDKKLENPEAPPAGAPDTPGAAPPAAAPAAPETSPFVGGELYKIEELIGALDNKIDKVESRVDNRGELERISMLNGMSTSFGDLQNTIASLEGKIARGIQPKPTTDVRNLVN